ncbi:hypothetical protein ACJMK2_028945 [Sinanodonta woodiana]|uniref:Uncharacterized protein n=1 Tax=Sinanodonta woodiana TaxID=1069815 RepID=A0ABD3X8P2_SINWO
MFQISGTPSDVYQVFPNAISHNKSLDMNYFPAQGNALDFAMVIARAQKEHKAAGPKYTQCVMVRWSSNEIRQDQLQDPNIFPNMVPAKEGSGKPE